MSSLRERLESGQFVITTEMEPPKGTDLSPFLATTAVLWKAMRSMSPIISVPPCASSSVGGASVLAREGVEPFCSSRATIENRMALRSRFATGVGLGDSQRARHRPAIRSTMAVGHGKAGFRHRARRALLRRSPS